MRYLLWFQVFSVSALLLLSGCNPDGSKQPKRNYQKLSLSTLEKQTFVSKEDLDALFLQTRYVDAAEKNPLYITISRRLTKDAQYNLATILLENLQTTTQEEHEEKHLLLAQQYLNLRKFDQAQRALRRVQKTPASASIRYYLLQSWSQYEQGSYTSYLTTLNDATHHASIHQPQLEQALTLLAWRSIQLATPTQLEQLRAHPNYHLSGWLDLRELLDPMDNPQLIKSPPATLNQLQQWQKKYLVHAANKLFKPNAFQQDDNTLSQEKIGVILPLTGKHQRASQLIQKALFSTYLETRPPQQMISIYDSGKTPVQTLYHQAVEKDQVQSFIGPLTKLEIEELLAEHKLDKPTLVLNSSSQTNKQLTQYSLAPSQETGQLIDNMILSGYRHPLILSDDSSLSKIINSDFTEKFKTEGGVIAESISLSENFNQGIASAIGTQDSQKRYRFAQSLSPEPIRAVTDKRHDIDSIFIAGDLKNIRQLIPMLKYHYSGNLPIFSTSTINKTANPHKNQDLSSAIFFDAPLSPALQTSPKRADLPKKIMDSLQAADPGGFYEAFRFYGLGYDAYMITQTGYVWDVLDGYYVVGVNGMLTKDPAGHIHRDLSRMIFKNGIAVVDTRYDQVREQWRKMTHSYLQ